MLTRQAGRRGSTSGRHDYQQPLTFVQSVRRSFLFAAIGLFLVCISVGLVFWNEGRAVQTLRSLEEGLQLIHSLDSMDKISDEHRDELVHISGPLISTEMLSDVEYGVSLRAVKLKRIVEMYQWAEREHKQEIEEEGRVETSYSYYSEWMTQLSDSQQFSMRPGHHNPTSMPPSVVHVADKIRIGNFFLSHNLIDKVNNFKRLPISTTATPIGTDLSIHDGFFYLPSADPHQPKIGDIRVKFEYAGCSGPSTFNVGPPDVVSVIGRQDGDTVREYRTQGAEQTLELLYMGLHSAQSMFGQEKASNTLLTWALRFAGWLLAFIGLGCWTSILLTLVDWFPVIRDLFTLGANIMNSVLALCLTLSVIAVGWIWYRPLLGLAVLFVASLPLLLARLRGFQTTSRTDRNW